MKPEEAIQFTKGNFFGKLDVLIFSSTSQIDLVLAKNRILQKVGCFTKNWDVSTKTGIFNKIMGC